MLALLPACSKLPIVRSAVRMNADSDRMPERQYNGLGEAVGGVHSGKYHFDLTKSFEGESFASALASSSGPTTQMDCYVTDDSNETWPKWATRTRGQVSEDELPRVVVPADGMATVKVVNPLRTWEPFYASIFLRAEGEGIIEADEFAVSPRKGTLAPRGGANNVCDPSKPYSDAIELTVRRCGSAPAGGARLLVRTEEEQWMFLLEAHGPDPSAATRDPEPNAEKPTAQRDSRLGTVRARDLDA